MWPACSFVLVDPDPWFRRGLDLVVRTKVAFRVTGSVASIDQLQPSMFAAPPVFLVIDLDHAAEQERSAIDYLTTSYGDVRVLVLAPRITSEALIAALRVHAFAFITRTDHPDTFLDVVRRVLHGEQVINDLVGKGLPFRRVMRALHASDHAQIDANRLLSPLTEHQLELLQLLAAGIRINDIAMKYGEHRRRIEDRLVRICTQLAVKDRHQAVTLALQKGWITLPALAQEAALLSDALIDLSD